VPGHPTKEVPARTSFRFRAKMLFAVIDLAAAAMGEGRERVSRSGLRVVALGRGAASQTGTLALEALPERAQIVFLPEPGPDKCHLTTTLSTRPSRHIAGPAMLAAG
jgi:hypothetical protein